MLKRARDPSEWSILILSRHSTRGASSRIRTFQYIPYLQAHNASVAVAPFFDNGYLSALYSSGRRRPFDIVRAYTRRLKAIAGLHRASVLWIEKELFPFLPGLTETLPARLGIPYVVDYDDATFHTYDANPNRLVRWLLATKLDPLLVGANAVTAGNAYLESYVRRRGACHVERVPTVVDLASYAASPEPATAEIRIGWIGTPATAKYLELLREPLRRVAKAAPIRFVTIGARTPDGFEIPLEYHPWSAATEARLLSSIHFGVMPLPDEPWERGKCGYKLIQYMAAARPAIASPVGVNRDIVSEDVGLLADRPEDWATALLQLVQDRQSRTRMGAAARMKVANQFCLDITAPKICRLLWDAAFRRHAAVP